MALGSSLALEGTFSDSGELIRVEDGGLFAIDRLRYVPPGSTQLGCIFYEGLINGSSEYDGKWFPTTPAGDEVMKRIMASTPSTPPDRGESARGCRIGVSPSRGGIRRWHDVPASSLS